MADTHAAFTTGDRGAAAALDCAVADPTARALLDFLVAHPDQRFDTAALAAALGLQDHRALARGAFLIGQICAALGRQRPWQEAQLGYRMSAEVAALFVNVRAERARP